MLKAAKVFMALASLVLVAGCTQDRPHRYGQQRPDVDSLHPADRGLQSKDVVSASDQMARDLLGADELRRSQVQWTMVTDRMEDRTLGRDFAGNYDIFIQRLRSNLGVYGKGNVQLIENRARLEQLRGRELDGPRDQFQQGSGAAPMGRLQPDFALHGKVFDMPNRGTNYYLLQFDVTDLRSGAIVWSNKYEVRVAR
jgi:PBP1b-binding outer membrane lipoprotein LpoB